MNHKKKKDSEKCLRIKCNKNLPENKVWPRLVFNAKIMDKETAPDEKF